MRSGPLPSFVRQASEAAHAAQLQPPAATELLLSRLRREAEWAAHARASSQQRPFEEAAATITDRERGRLPPSGLPGAQDQATRSAMAVRGGAR